MAEEKKVEKLTDRSENKSAEKPAELFKNGVDKIKKNPWIIVSFGLVIVVLFLIFGKGITGGVISETTAGEKVVEFASNQGIDAQVISVTSEGSLYEVVVSVEGQEVPTYITKDGNYFISAQGLISLSTVTGDAVVDTKEQTAKDIPKSDKPLVELFVMTYCPYGLQAEKGIIPAFNSLGNKIEGKIRFVHYFMHGDNEEQETYRQVCIREEQSSKFLPYLSCFAEKGDSGACMTQAGVDSTKVNTCVINGNGKNYYAEDSKLSQGYGVQGSPTLVINGVESSAGRDSQSYLDGICAAFNNAPSECSQKLSSTAPSSGFGSGTTPSSGSAQCG